MAQSCTYTFNGPDGKEVTIRGMAAMKAYLVDGGMEFFQTKGVRFDDGLDVPAVLRSSDSLNETINVDGVDRPTKNSEGRPIHPTEEGIRNFWRWFKDSKVVDADGKPLVVYHGSEADITSFQAGISRRTGRASGSGGRGGFYFAQKPSLAAQYAGEYGAVYPVYLRIQNPMPYEVESGGNKRGEGGYKANALFPGGFIGDQDEIVRALDAGYDGVIKGNEIAAFRPEQVKSATGNTGAFDPNEAPITLRDKGSSGSSANPDPSNQRITRAQADGFISGFLAKYANAPQVTLVNTFDQLPATVQQEARNQGGNASDTKGVFHRGQVYLVAGNHSTVADFEATVFHEVIGHAGVRALFGPDFVKTANRLFMQLGGQAGLVKIMQRRGMGQQASDYINGVAQAQRKELDQIRADMAAGKPGAQRRWNDAIARFVLTEEVFAHIAEQVKDRPSMMDKMKELIGKIRQWLRDKGFAELSNLGETDILFMLSKARQNMQGKNGGNITRNGVTVSGNDLMTSDGRRLNKDDPDYASAMRLADLLGLRQEPGVTTFSNRRSMDDMSDRNRVASEQAPNPAGDGKKGGATPLVTTTHPTLGMRVPVRVVSAPGERGMRFAIEGGQATLRINPAFASDRQYVRTQMANGYALDDFLWPFGDDVFIRTSDSAQDYDHIKAGTHRGSKNHATGETEGGLSVSRQPAHAAGKHAYLVRGNRIGQGSDGEPLLDVASVRVASKRMSLSDAMEMLDDAIKERAKGMGLSAKELRALRTATDLDFSRINEPSAPVGSGVVPSTFRNEQGTNIPPALERLAGIITGKKYEAAKRQIAAQVGSVRAGEKFSDDVADAVFLRLQRVAQIGRYTDMGDLAYRNAKRLEGDELINLFRSAPKGAGIRPGDFTAGSKSEAGYYKHGGNVIQSIKVPRKDVIAVDGSSGGGQEYVYLPEGYVAQEPLVYFNSFRAFFDAVNGNFDPNEAPITLRRAPSATQQQGREMREKIADTFRAMTGDTARTFNWWNRTIGSQYNKAKKSPEFKKVYDRAHDFIDDVSRFANEAADRARNILPHLDTWKDIGAGLNVRKAWADAKDYQAIAPAIFEGTLANGTTGKVWSDEELSSLFNLNEKQKGLYREFRDAVNFSLDTLAKSEMTRAARAAKLDAAESNLSLDETLAFYVGQVDDQIAKADALVDAVKKQHAAETEAFMKEFGDKLQSGRYRKAVEVMVGRQNAELEAAERAGEGLDDLRKSFTDKAERIQQLKDEGYAPLMRFGQYTVDVVRLDEDGKPIKGKGGEQDRPFFGMFESESEAREAARILQEEYPDYTVTRGVLSDKSNELFKGVTPETAELFAKMLGTSETEGFQAYLKQAVANRSAMKRLIQRKGMEGFSTDVPRVLASFITSNARLSSGNLHFGEMAKAVADIPKTKGDVADEAIKLMQYIQNPQEEAAALRGLLFFNFLGGSVAAALVNTTQTVTTTLPYLNQFGARNAASAISKATIAAANVMRKPGFDGVQDKALRDALQRASEEGIIDPQEIHLLMAESMGNGASSLAGRVAGMVNKDLQVPVNRFTRSLTQAWGGLFSVAEKYNRHVAFMAAWDVAGKMTPEQLAKAGAKDRFDFAKQAVIETQFEYNKVNRPNWARGAVGATLFTFKTFLVNYMEFIKRLPSREKALAVGVLFLLSGMSGAPGSDDLDDLIDSIGQKLGYNWNNKAGRHAWLMETVGKDATNFIEHGVSSFLPIDVSARLGMGNIIPGTGIFKKSSDDKGRDAAEFFGPAGSLAKGAMTVFDDLGTGKPLGELVRPVMPKAYNDAYQAMDVAQTGYYRDSKGRKVVEADAVDALAKAIGFQPNAVAEPRRVEFMLAQSANMVRVMRADIHELWARGVAEGDREKVQAAQDMLREWNEKNRETPIRPNLQSIQQRVRAMRLSSAERLVKATTKEMRGMVSASLVAESLHGAP